MNRIVIVDDHPAFRAWARAVLAADGFRVAGEAADAAGAVAQVQAVRPDVVRMMPPLTITADEVDAGVDRLEAAVREVAAR